MIETQFSAAIWGIAVRDPSVAALNFIKFEFVLSTKGVSMMIYLYTYTAYINGSLRASRSIHHSLIEVILGSTLVYISHHRALYQDIGAGT